MMQKTALRGAVTTIAAAMMIIGGVASASAASNAQEATAAEAAAASMSCTTKAYRTVGKATCKGTGLFKVKLDCKAPQIRDKESGWVRINNSTASAYAECKYGINHVQAITRPS